MALDPARFRLADKLRVWGHYPCCILTNRNTLVDFQHILGRGELFGASKLDHPLRRAMSSPFNQCPLVREIHAGPRRDTREIRRLCLRVAREMVMQAVGRDEYELTEDDQAFLALADQWKEENPC
jgi:hypothetical protein